MDKVKAYFDRIGLTLPEHIVCDGALLKKIQYAHCTTIPYENLDIIRNIPLSLEEDDLFEKIVVNHRGGYCFELNGLYGWLLRQLGYKVTDCFARYLRGESTIPMRRHRVLKVEAADGTYLCDLVSTAGQLDAFGHKAILSGTSRYLSDLIHDKLNCKSRAIEFSTLQRCASHLASRTDVNEAYAVGGAAAAAAFAGETGKMIALKRVSEYPYQCITEAVDVQQVANLEKKVPLDWITPDGMQVTAAFEEYARPLILDEVTPVYVNGTPRHICL